MMPNCNLLGSFTAARKSIKELKKIRKTVYGNKASMRTQMYNNKKGKGGETSGRSVAQQCEGFQH
jgi:hypothetical protein